MADATSQDVLSALGLPQPTAPVGTPVQIISSATGTSGPPSAGQTEPDPSVVFRSGPATPPPSAATAGPELLPKIDFAIKHYESGNSQTDPKTGKIVTSPAGALGISQLMPGTAAHLGVDPYNEQQNAEGGRRYAKELYDTYGNWPDAVAAYNAGPGRVDKWIAAGRPETGKDALPAETKKYVPLVLAMTGTSPGLSFVSQKDGSNPQDVLEALREHSTASGGGSNLGPPSQDDDALTASLLSANQNPVDVSPEGQAETLALLGGTMVGLRDVITGPVQAGLELAGNTGVMDPRRAADFTNWVNEHLEPFEQQRTEHPWANFAGEMVGTGLGIAGVTRMVGPLAGPMAGTAVGMAMRSLPTAVKAGAAGAALGATAYNKDPAAASRLGEGVLGALMGGFGTMLGRLVGQGLTRANDAQVVQQWLAQLKQNVAGLEPSVSGLKQAFASRYAAMESARNARYTVRDQAGREIEGYPTGLEGKTGVAQVITDAMQGNVGRDQASAQTRTAAREMDRVLGLDEQRQRQAAADRAEKEYGKSFGDWGKEKIGGRLLSTLPVATQESLIRQGMVPNRPPPPVAFQSVPITAEKMAEARRVVNRAIGRARDTATRTQLNILKRSLDNTASETAKAAGVDVAEYERLQARADAFNKKVIAPMRRLAGGKTSREFAEGSTNAEMYNTVVKALKGNDREEQEALAHVLGARGRQQARQAILHDMMDHAITSLDGKVDPNVIARYVHANRIGLQTILGRDEFAQLEGNARLAQEMVAEVKHGGLAGFIGHHGWYKSLAALKLAEGEVHQAVRMGGIALGLELLRAGVSRIAQTPRLFGVMARMAHVKPGSPEMKRLIGSVDAAMTAQTRMLSRIVPQETGGEPATTGLEVGGDVIGAGSSMFFSGPGR